MQILNDLRRAGLIESRRGKAGGYLLGRDPESVSLLDIVEAVEPSILANSTTSAGQSGDAVRCAWDGISSATRRELEAIPLRALAGDGDAPMYYI